MDYTATDTSLLDVPFTSFPLGLTFQQRWVSEEECEFIVEKITREGVSQKAVKPGYILVNLQGRPISAGSLQELSALFLSYKSRTSMSSPLVCSFRKVDPSGQGTPLFDPFNNKNELDSGCDNQNVEKYERTRTRIPMSTFGLGCGKSTNQGPCREPGCRGQCQQIMGITPYGFNDVMNSNDLVKHIINIDSDYRDTISQATTNFVVKLDPLIKNVIRIKLASVEIPNTFYEFSATKRNITLRLISPSRGTDHSFTIRAGNYDSAQLQTALNNLFLSFVPQYNITIDPISAKTTLSTVDFSDFIMDFRTEWNSPEVNPDLFAEQFENWGLGYNLGYRKKYYSGESSYQSEAIINTLGDPYLFLKINDYHVLKHPYIDENYMEAFAKIILRTDKNTIIFNDNSDVITREVVFQQPRDIKRLHISLVDKTNTNIDLNDMPMCVALEITEVTNCKLYDFYRNYLFNRQLT